MSIRIFAKILDMDIYHFFKSFHGYVALLACFLIIVLTLMTLIYFFRKVEVSAFFRKMALFTLITFHIQMLVGLVLLFTNKTFLNSFMEYKIQGKISLMEHLPTNFTVVLLVTIFYSLLKRSKKISFLLLILLTVALILLGRTFMLLNGLM